MAEAKVAGLTSEAQQPAQRATVNPWMFFTASQIATVAEVPIENVWAHWPEVAEELAVRGIFEREVCAGVIGTMAIETASTFLPVREAYWPLGPNGEETPAWREAVKRYYPHFGRGDVQITWPGGYREAGEAIGVDLLANPGLALDRRISAKVIAWWFAVKGVPSKDGIRFYRLVDLCRERDWYWTRVAVQGGAAHLDRLVTIADTLISTQGASIMTANDSYRVTDGPARLRARPGASADVVQMLPVGTPLVDVGDPLTDADGHQWRRVAIGGPVGWIADELLGSTAAPAPPPGTRYQFDPSTPTYLQRLKWTCSIASVIWCLRSIGVAVTPEEAHDAMVGRYVDARGDDGVGLLDASGAGIVEVLRLRWGVTAFNRASVSFDDMAGWAGRMPVALGLPNWGGPTFGHWSAVRSFDGSRLILANPAGSGPRFGQQTLTRQEFDARGPASAVIVPLE